MQQWKNASHMFQSQFTEKKNVDKKLDIPSSFQVLSEIMEATTAVLDKKVCGQGQTTLHRSK